MNGTLRITTVRNSSRVGVMVEPSRFKFSKADYPSRSDLNRALEDKNMIPLYIADLITRTLRKHDIWVEVEPFMFTSGSKRDLIGHLKILHQEGRLRFAAAETDPVYTRLLEELVDELMNYEVRIEDEGPEKYGVFKTGKHDDLVTALALATRDSEFEKARPRLLSAP